MSRLEIAAVAQEWLAILLNLLGRLRPTGGAARVEYHSGRHFFLALPFV